MRASKQIKLAALSNINLGFLGRSLPMGKPNGFPSGVARRQKENLAPVTPSLAAYSIPWEENSLFFPNPSF